MVKFCVAIIYALFNMKLLADIEKHLFNQLLLKYGIDVCHLETSADIPGSYWGAPEAGIIRNQLFVRPDTPVHSALHESCHYICMNYERRQNLHTDTGGDYDEENAVCFLQIILADFLPSVSQSLLCDDMDEWGYTFRLGSARRWFTEDATDTFEWLTRHDILDSRKQPTWKTRH